MNRIVLDVPVDELPDLIRRAVAEVPHANLVEVSADGAMISRGTNFAIRAEATRLAFVALDDGRTRVEVVVPPMHMLVWRYFVTTDTAALVLAALERIVHDSDRSRGES